MTPTQRAGDDVIRHGSLCTGYGGLDMAVTAVLGGEMAWCAENDKAASKVVEARFPGVRNLGDITKTDWSELPSIDVLTAGYPCQPFSAAGKRKGTNDPRHLWPHIADAVRVLRPRFLIAENVDDHLSLGFDVVLADLAGLRFDVEWTVVRASDVGACHQRARLFFVATDAERVEGGLGHDADLLGRRQGEAEQARLGSGAAAHPDDDGDAQRERADQRVAGPPRAGEGREAQRQRLRDASRRPGEAPADAHGDGRALERSGEHDAWYRPWLDPDGRGGPWEEYGPAIERHEQALGRRAPSPVNAERKLSPAFVEWMMMLPAGHVTDVVDLTRNQQLKILGNGVVPPAARHAVGHLLKRERVAA